MIRPSAARRYEVDPNSFQIFLKLARGPQDIGALGLRRVVTSRPANGLAHELAVPPNADPQCHGHARLELTSPNLSVTASGLAPFQNRSPGFAPVIAATSDAAVRTSRPGPPPAPRAARSAPRVDGRPGGSGGGGSLKASELHAPGGVDCARLALRHAGAAAGSGHG